MLRRVPPFEACGGTMALAHGVPQRHLISLKKSDVKIFISPFLSLQKIYPIPVPVPRFVAMKDSPQKITAHIAGQDKASLLSLFNYKFIIKIRTFHIKPLTSP